MFCINCKRVPHL